MEWNGIADPAGSPTKCERGEQQRDAVIKTEE